MAKNDFFFIVGSSQTVMNGIFNCFLYRFDILFNSILYLLS